MNDRELLELAAKAAGIAIQRSRLEDPLWRDMLLVERHKIHSGIAVGWNPLTDDGDALRLAVKLRFVVHTPCAEFRAAAQSQDLSRGVIENDGQEGLSESDPLAATRRAIVRAAAEIGRSLT